MTLSGPLVRSEALRKVFHPPRGRPVEAVCGATFSVEPGEIFGLLGPNRAGKTTLLRMLGTIITPTSGRCWVTGLSTAEAPDAVRRQVGFLSGNTKLYGRLTPRETLRYFGRLYGMAEEAITERAAALAEMLEMGAFVDQRCESLSTGQGQKVSIARVLLHDPPVLILDEPTLGLDIVSSRTILEFIQGAKARGRCVIFSTHYMTEAELLCDRIGFLYAGRLLALGPPGTLYAQTGTDNMKDAFLRLVDAEAERAS